MMIKIVNAPAKLKRNCIQEKAGCLEKVQKAKAE
jgi:hypothetical protein